jgi:hypothetical protein
MTWVDGILGTHRSTHCTSRPTCPLSTSLMLVTVVMAPVIAHEGRLCRPDRLTLHAVASGGGRVGARPPPANGLSLI